MVDFEQELLHEIANAIGFGMFSGDGRQVDSTDEGVPKITTTPEETAKILSTAALVAEHLFGETGKLQLGYMVKSEGVSGDLVKMYANFEDANVHYEFMTGRGFPLSVEMFRFNYQVLKSVKRATKEEYRDPNYDGRNDPAFQHGDAEAAAGDADSSVVDEELPQPPADI